MAAAPIHTLLSWKIASLKQIKNEAASIDQSIIAWIYRRGHLISTSVRSVRSRLASWKRRSFGIDWSCLCQILHSILPLTTPPAGKDDVTPFFLLLSNSSAN